ncbi:unnamed protein product [Brassica napus]|uniref:(rape) hypothetical protein n=1 Tax=Brassica napus TaxID=3708 RepID=A0A816JM31_BRANA|nr:unnamed protein product [Brassica napus]
MSAGKSSEETSASSSSFETNLHLLVAGDGSKNGREGANKGSPAYCSIFHPISSLFLSVFLSENRFRVRNEIDLGKKGYFGVPDCMREVKPEAYTPQLVLIGPLHRPLKFQALKALDRGDYITYTKSMDYLNMEQHKKYYLAAFAERFEGEEIIDGFRRMIEEEEENIRESYSESTAWIKSSEFVEMVLHDSVFIIEFMLRKKIGDPLMDRGCFVNTLFKDLILLENQLPYFILEKLFDQIVQRILPQKTFRDLIISFFNLQVDDRLEMTLRNIMALEQCHYPFNAHVCIYILFIDRLIHTKKAADLLVEKGIIKNRTRERHPVKQMVNKLRSGIAATGSYYFDIEGEVNKYSENRVNRSKAVLKRVFFW